MPPMLDEARAIYFATRKRHDQLFNVYVMRPLAAGVVTLVQNTGVTPNQLTLVALGIFVIGAILLVALDGYLGGVIAVLTLELSYLFDCADGMLARHKRLASQEGHLFDFFTDELKATLLVGALALRLYRGGGYAADLTPRGPQDPLFLIAGIVALGVVASALSLTNFVRRPELTGKETPVEAHYETVERPAQERTPVQQAAGAVTTFLRFFNHYPSHIWLLALLGRLDLFFWLYGLNNLAYLARGWLGLLVRFGRG
jgi:phosphatidylglycerophosphate synthase